MTDVLSPSSVRPDEFEGEFFPGPAARGLVDQDILDDEFPPPFAEPVHTARQSRSGRWVLAAVVGVEVIGSLRLRNSVFQDEALYLWAGHQITSHVLHATPLVGSFSSYFSGSPGIYPVLGSLVDGVAGLAGARALSLGWMIVATLCVYAITKRLFSHSGAAAPAAAAAFALSAPILFIGHLATFDAMCLGLLAVATYVSVRAASARRAWWTATIGPILVLAVLTKYAGALFVPSIFAILMLESYRHAGAMAALKRLGVALVALVGAFAIVMAAFGTSILTGLQSTTTNRTVLLASPPGPLVMQALTLGGYFAAVALCGCFMVSRRQRLLGVVLFATVLLAPAYHIYKGEPVSLAKHVGFGLFFAAPLVGRALAGLTGKVNRLSGRRFATGVAVGLLLTTTGFARSSRLVHEWSNSDSLVVTLRSLVRPGSGHILAEEAEVPRYRLRTLVEPWQWSDLNWFEYRSRNGTVLTGLDAYRTAIQRRYFDVIVLRYGANAGTAVAIRDDIQRAGAYEKVATLPFTTSFGTGAYSVWRLASASAPTLHTGGTP